MESKIDLDAILENLDGFGKYQKLNYCLICLIMVFSVFPLSYVFTTRSTNYRCAIDFCDNSSNSRYDAPWLKNVIPYKDNAPKKCSYYAPVNVSYAQSSDYCLASDNFNRSVELACDRFIYEQDSTSIQSDFNITCDSNLWRLTIIGTLNNVVEIISLPLSGFVSDRYGRRTIMIISVLLSTVCGILRSFADNYRTYVALEFLDTFVSSGTYSAAYILAIELVVPKQRVLLNALMSCAFALGESVLGLVAWISPNWRIMLRILYIPGFMFVSYYWLTYESVRWLISKGRHEEANKILAVVSKTNGVTLDVTQRLNPQNKIDDNEVNGNNETFCDFLRSAKLMRRLINCSFAWICSSFVFYGLTMHSVSISGNTYINFITVALVEMPAYFVSYCTLDKIGRRNSLSASLIISGLSCIAFIFIPAENTSIQLVFFLIGKFGITISLATLYIYTAEMFPTNLRHSILAVCSMFARLGVMVAPQLPLLSKISKMLPLILFGTMSSTSGLLSLLFPETLNTKLPETIEQAANIERLKQQS